MFGNLHHHVYDCWSAFNANVYGVDASMTQLRRVQKENEQYRGQLEMLQRDRTYWELKAKQLEMQLSDLLTKVIEEKADD